MQSPSPRFGSQQFFLSKICGAMFNPNLQRFVWKRYAGWAPNWRLETNRNICHRVLLQKRKLSLYRGIRVRALEPVSRKVFTPESRSKISNLTITELFYSHILNMNRSSFHTRSFTRIHLSVIRSSRSKIGFSGPKSFGAFETLCCVLEQDTLLSQYLS